MSKTKKLLIVEDDRFLARSYEIAFGDSDFELTTLFDGGSVLKVVKKLQPDIILLDILLPQKNGFEILKELKADPSTKKIPVVIASNLGQPEEVTKGKNLGAIAYIVKSETSIADVIKVVKNHS